MTDQFQDAEIPENAYVDDHGDSHPAILAALETGATAGTYLDAVETLLDARLLVGLIAILDSTDDTGGEKDSHMAAAMLTREDGRSALLAFTSTERLADFSAEARPLPVPASDAARATIEDGADTLLIDGRYPITGAALWALAERRIPRPPSEDPAVVDVIRDLATTHLGSESYVELTSDDDNDLIIVLDAVMDRDMVQQFAEGVSSNPIIRTRVSRGVAIGMRSPGP